MVRIRSPFSERARRAWVVLAIAAVTLLSLAWPVYAQDDLDRQCDATGASRCHLAAAAVRLIQPRVGKALWGGNPVPGTASTLGMRIGSMPRIGLAGRLTVVPAELPPLQDLTATEGERALLPGLAAQATVGILGGFSPVATVGGVLSLDGIAGVSYVPLSGDRGFEGGVWGGLAGLRVGALRESFTLPGVSLTGTWGRSGHVVFGDPDGGRDGYIDGAISNLNATLAVTKRIVLVGVTAGAAWDRYSSDVRLAYRSTPGGPVSELSAEAVTERWSGFVNAALTTLIFHAAVEVGWQDAPVPEGVPATVSLDPAHLWVGLAFRISI